MLRAQEHEQGEGIRSIATKRAQLLDLRCFAARDRFAADPRLELAPWASSHTWRARFTTSQSSSSGRQSSLMVRATSSSSSNDPANAAWRQCVPCGNHGGRLPRDMVQALVAGAAPQ